MKSPAPAASSFNPWPWALIAFFVVFISLVAAFITFALGQDMELVRPDYYESEVRYQEQINRMERTLSFEKEVTVHYDALGQFIELQLPAQHALRQATGRIQFYRPSDAALDHEVTLALGRDGKQRVTAAELTGGLWNLHIFWEVNGQEYYTKKTLVISSNP